MNRHAGPPANSAEPAVPEPTYAESARTLLHLGRTGTLATLSRKHPGHPFASLMPYALDQAGRPLMLISSMAMHTQNLAADPRASLLVVQPTLGDPLAAGRLTLMGEARTVPEAEREAAKSFYLALHANAVYWVDFDDFAFWRLELSDVYFVGGFGAMGWVAADEYLAARPDPLAEASESIREHVNGRLARELLAYASRLLDVRPDEATLVSVDRLGFKLRLRTRDRVHSVRIAFPVEVSSAEQCHEAFAALLQATA